MQIAKGLHRIGSDTVNSYLVVDGGGVTIIDAGLPRSWKLLNGELARLGMTLDDVQALILTHGDTDHIGFAGRLHREKGIPAYLHPADAGRARLEVKKPNSGWGLVHRVYPPGNWPAETWEQDLLGYPPPDARERAEEEIRVIEGLQKDQQESGEESSPPSEP